MRPIAKVRKSFDRGLDAQQSRLARQQNGDSEQVRHVQNSRTMAKAALISAVVASALTATAFLLNPSPEQHRARIKESIADRSPIAGALGLGVLTAFTSTYHPLGVASYTTVSDRVVSVGAFGMVFVLPPAQEK